MPSGKELYSPLGRKRSGRQASGSAQVLCTACASHPSLNHKPLTLSLGELDGLLGLRLVLAGSDLNGKCACEADRVQVLHVQKGTGATLAAEGVP